MLLVGTYTETLPHVRGSAPGLFVGSLGDLAVVPARNPSWLAASATHVYAVAEAIDGAITVFVRESGGLRHVQTIPSGGAEPAHLSLDPSERFLVVANYGDGVVTVFPLLADGRLGPPSDSVQHVGSSADPVRQSSAHPHQVSFDPATGELVVADLGLDAVVRYSLDDEGRLHEAGRMSLPPGSGPRHVAFHPDGRHLLVVNELTSTVAVFRGAELLQVVSTLPPEFAAASYASAIRVSRSGRDVLVANRGHDSVAVLTWGRGRLEATAWESTRGRTPRDLVLSPSEDAVLVANQDSHTVATFDRAESGELTFRELAPVASPACLVFLP